MKKDYNTYELVFYHLLQKNLKVGQISNFATCSFLSPEAPMFITEKEGSDPLHHTQLVSTLEAFIPETTW